MTDQTNPQAYYGTLAELETTSTPSIERFPTFEEYSEVINATHTTLTRIVEEYAE